MNAQNKNRAKYISVMFMKGAVFSYFAKWENYLLFLRNGRKNAGFIKWAISRSECNVHIY